MKRFGLEPYEDLAKFDPAQPRVPAGSGRESGRWTDGAATAASASASTLIEGGSAAPPALSPAIFKPDAMASETAIVPVRAGGVVKPSAPDPQAAAAWQSFKDSFATWLREEVPVYDQDTGLQYGTQSRERAILTNPLIVGALALSLAKMSRPAPRRGSRASALGRYCPMEQSPGRGKAWVKPLLPCRKLNV